MDGQWRPKDWQGTAHGEEQSWGFAFAYGLCIATGCSSNVNVWAPQGVLRRRYVDWESTSIPCQQQLAKTIYLHTHHFNLYLVGCAHARVLTGPPKAVPASDD